MLVNLKSKTASPLTLPLFRASTTVPVTREPEGKTVVPRMLTGRARCPTNSCPAWLVPELKLVPVRISKVVPDGTTIVWDFGGVGNGSAVSAASVAGGCEARGWGAKG